MESMVHDNDDDVFALVGSDQALRGQQVARLARPAAACWCWTGSKDCWKIWPSFPQADFLALLLTWVKRLLRKSDHPSHIYTFLHIYILDILEMVKGFYICGSLHSYFGLHVPGLVNLRDITAENWHSRRKNLSPKTGKVGGSQGLLEDQRDLIEIIDLNPNS